MNSTKTRVAAVAALLVLTGCSGTSEPAAAPTTEAAPEASATSTPTTAPSMTSSSSASGPTSSMSPTPGSTAGSAGTTGAAMTEICQEVVEDQQAALDAVAEYVRAPLTGDVDVADLEDARNELRDDAADVPGEVRTQLRSQIAILDNLIEGIRTRSIKNVDVDEFRRAARQVADRCQMNG